MNKINLFSLPMLLSFLVIYLIASGVVLGITLSTIDRWIVDENAKRVKFACVNWPSHLETIVAEGLSKQPLDVISKKIGSMGFNCVRLTYPISLVTDGSLAYKTVLDYFEGLELHDFIAGFQANNPSFLSLTLTRAFQAVVSNLGENNVMVILDNHISKQGWCCSDTGGNGFFGDQYFDPDLWLKGLTQMATMFSNTSNVVAMSLRNELRGHRENVDDWYRYMQQGAEVVHSSNPNVLVILSGLNFAADLSFLKDERAVVSNMGDNDVMVILDNHLTMPGWCCGQDDGNGFFGDKYFDPDLWVEGLSRMATIFRGTKNVVGMSLRNELRGPRQNMDLWYMYMQQGAEVVHTASPNVLVILSGLDFDTNLSFLKNKHVNISFTEKLVFEMHWYAFTAGNGAWAKHNANQMCGSVVNGMMGRTGYLVQQGWPMFLSEYGANLSMEDVYDARYLACLFGVVADLDLDWALWSLQGSYYFRQGVKDMDETYGVLSSNWNEIRNPGFLQKISSIQDLLQGPGLSVSPYNIVYHPSSGLCILNQNNNLILGSCSESKEWNYTQQKTIILKETNSCLQAVGLGKYPVLASACTDSSSQWEIIADSRMHLSAKLADGAAVCLDSDNNGGIVTNQCKCLYNDIECNPASQWFKIISSSRSLSN